MIGWIKLHRVTTEHWIWSNPIKFQWWIRMLMEVNHSNKEILIGNTIYMIERGQSGKSLRTWASLFGVGTKAVVNFFELLEEDKMIVRKTIGKGKHSTTLIIITNYENYQGVEETLKPTQSATQSTTQEKHEGHTNKNDKEITNNENNEKRIVENKNFDDFEFDFNFQHSEKLKFESQEWIESVSMQQKISIEEILKKIDEFVLFLKTIEKIHESKKEFINHFINWLTKKIQNEKPLNGTKQQFRFNSSEATKNLLNTNGKNGTLINTN